MSHPAVHTTLLLAIDPIVQAWTKSGSPCGDPMGIEHWTECHRLSEVVRDHGWLYAFALPETKRLLSNIGGAL